MFYTEACSIKINLALRVLDKRPDGYHNISSLYWRLKSPEVLDVDVDSRGDELEVQGADIPGENIVSRACAHIRSVCGGENLPGVRVRLYKHLPMGSGVGAGSGNAAALIRFLRRYGRQYRALPGIVDLGADVVFLASDFGLALAGGVGDLLEGLDGELRNPAVILFPEWAVNTRDAYAAIDAVRAGGRGAMAEPEAREEAMSVLSALRGGRRIGLLPNDFMECVPFRPRYDEMCRAADDSGALAWGLCGSGSAFFVLCENPGGCVSALRGREFKWLRQILVLE